VLEDCCAEPDPENHALAIKLLKIESGYLATVSTSDAFIQGLALSSSAKSAHTSNAVSVGEAP